MIALFGLPFMRLALGATLLLVPVLAYFGVHVIRRRIVFVDLAVAQLSAVGVAVGSLAGIDPTAPSLAITLIGALLLSIPVRSSRIPGEAVMGIVYAVGSAVALLLIAKTPHGEADVLKLFFGDILAVTRGNLFEMGGMLVMIAVIHRFVSMNEWGPAVESAAAKTGVRNRLSEAAFYVAIGLVIALSIRAAGVLLVFTYLIGPAMMGTLIARRPFTAWLCAVVLGWLSGVVGLYLSYTWDLPSGSSMVASCGAVLALVAAFRAFSAR